MGPEFPLDAPSKFILNILLAEAPTLFKPLIEKGLPHFWDENNYLLKKEAFDNLLVQRRNDHLKIWREI